MSEKSLFTKIELEIIQTMIKTEGNTKKATEVLGITENAINQRFARLRRKNDKARAIVNTYEAWRRNPYLRKRLF